MKKNKQEDGPGKEIQLEGGSSVFKGGIVEPVKEDAFIAPTSFLLAFLVVVMVGLKSFIYIKDKKKDGK